MNRISQLTESGIYEHQIQKSLRPKGFGKSVIETINKPLNFEALSLTQLKGVFLLLLIGHSLAIIVFFIELFIGKSVNRSNRRITVIHYQEQRSVANNTTDIRKRFAEQESRACIRLPISRARAQQLNNYL